MQHKKRYGSLAVAAFAVLAAAACSDDDGITDPFDEIPDGQASFEIVLAPADAAAASLGALQLAPQSPSWARIPLSAVESINLPIGEVEAKQGSGEGGAWLDAGSVDATVDLMDLPEEGITLVDSSLPEGNYSRLRFFLTGQPTIVLSETVEVGRVTFEAGEHPLEIPSSEQNGVRLNADFDVDEDGEILTVLFDGGATVRRVVATGSGVLKIAPELRVTNEAGEDVGELDDDPDDDDDDEDGEDEGDEDDEAEFEGTVASVDSDTEFTLGDGTVVRIHDGTEISGDILSLAAVAEAIGDGEVVEAEGEGSLADDGAILADEVEFETDDDDGDDDADDDDEEEAEGPVTAVDRDAQSVTIQDEESGDAVVVLITDDTEIDPDGDFDTFDAMADAFDAGTAIEAEAEGELDAEGRLVADEVKFETDS